VGYTAVFLDGEAKESAKKPKKASWYMQLFFLAGAQYFRRLGRPTKICCIVFVGWMGRRKYVEYFHWPRWPMKIVLFSLVADENAFIFVDFIPSAYFRRSADKNSYFRRLLGYFQRFLADEITLFSCSDSTCEAHVKEDRG
jgi:hypothetical protein